MDDHNSTELDAFTCPNCGGESRGVACISCGQTRVHEDDLSLKHALHQTFEELSHLDSRLFTTLKLLFFRPGQLTLDYLEGRRKRHLHPLRLFLIVAAIAFFTLQHTGFKLATFVKMLRPQLQAALIDPSVQKLGVDRETFVNKRSPVFDRVFNLSQTVVEPLLVGLTLWAVFRKRYRYFAQHVLFYIHYSTFTMAFNTIINSLSLMIIQVASLPPAIQIVMAALMEIAKVAYLLMAVRCVYQEGMMATAAKTLFTYVGRILAATIALAGAFLIAILL